MQRGWGRNVPYIPQKCALRVLSTCLGLWWAESCEDLQCRGAGCRGLDVQRCSLPVAAMGQNPGEDNEVFHFDIMAVKGKLQRRVSSLPWATNMSEWWSAVFSSGLYLSLLSAQLSQPLSRGSSSPARGAPARRGGTGQCTARRTAQEGDDDWISQECAFVRVRVRAGQR